MSEQTPVQRAAGLYETALSNRRGRQCSETQFFAAREQARGDVQNVLVLEGMETGQAADLARAGELYWDARRRGRVRE